MTSRNTASDFDATNHMHPDEDGPRCIWCDEITSRKREVFDVETDEPECGACYEKNQERLQGGE